MSTGELQTYFEDKRNLPQQRIKDTFFDYLLVRLREISSRVWGGERGVFGTLTLVSGGNDKFSVQTLPGDLLDGDGNVLTLSGTDGTGIQFENTAATTYYVGAKYVKIPSGVLRNQRNDVIFYDTEEDRIGERAEPDAVSEVAGTLEIQVDSVFETGVSHAGRLVTVWLKRPLTTVESVAVERNLVVQWTGGVNKVVTSGLLGQASGAASTAVADYEVAAQGVTVRKTDLSTVDPYAYLGTVTGGGAGNPPAAYSMLGQIDVSDGINPDLQEAYTAGRTISPSAAYGGAVKIASADAGDAFNSILHLDRKGATEATPVNLANVLDQDGVGQLNLYPISHSTVLQVDEAAQVNAGTDGQVDLTRGGVNLGTANTRRDADLVLLSGFATAEVNGLHKLASDPSGATAYLERLDGGSMAAYWAGAGGETGTASFLRLGLGVSRYALGSGTALQFGNPLVVNGVNENLDASPAVRIYPRQAENALECFTTGASPKLQAMITKWGTFKAQTEGNPGSPSHELYLSDRRGNIDPLQLGYLALCGDEASVPFAALKGLESSPYLYDEEDVTLAAAGNLVTFTRTAPAGLDLTQKDLRVSIDFNLLLITDAADPSDNGLYPFTAFSATTVTASTLYGTSPSFVGGAAKASIVACTVFFGGAQPLTGTLAERLRGIVLTLRDPRALTSALDLSIYTENRGKIYVYDGGKSTASTYKAPRDILIVDPQVIGDDNAHPIKLHRSTVINGGQAGGGDEEDFYSRDGLRIWNAGGVPDDRDPAFALAVDAGYPENLPTFHTQPGFAVDTLGGVSRGHHFRDDFFHRVDTPWVNAWPQPSNYATTFVGTGNIQCRDVSSDAKYGHGCVELTTGSTTYDSAELLLDPIGFNLDTSKDFCWTFRGRLAITSNLTNIVTEIGFKRSSNNLRYFFRFTNGAWYFMYWNGSSLAFSTESCGATVGQYQWFEIIVLPSLVIFTVDKKSHVANSYMKGSYSIPSLSGQSGAMSLACKVTTNEASSHSAILDYWEAWDTEALYGRMGNSYNQNHP